jgi:hypothetical protein
MQNDIGYYCNLWYDETRINLSASNGEVNKRHYTEQQTEHELLILLPCTKIYSIITILYI